MSDLLGELLRLPSAFDAAHQPLLDRLGLPSDLMLFISALVVSPIETDGQFFQPLEHGPLTLILPAYRGRTPSFACPSEGEPEPPHDLVAFRPDRPNRWWVRTGRADILGDHLIDSALLWRKALDLVATPLDYLRARCRVACLLDSHTVWKLRGISVVAVNPGELPFARRLDRLLKKPPTDLPKIIIRTEPAHERL